MQWHGKTCKYRHEQTSNMQEQMCDMGENSSATQKKIRENTRNKNFMNVGFIIDSFKELWLLLLSTNSISLHKSFLLMGFSLNVTKSAENCGLGHNYWKNGSWKTSYFMQCF